NSSRPANHHRVHPVGGSAVKQPNRVFERHRLLQLGHRVSAPLTAGPGTTPSSSLGRFRGTAAPAATRRPTGMAFLQRVTARRERLTRTRPLPVGVLLLVV